MGTRQQAENSHFDPFETDDPFDLFSSLLSGQDEESQEFVNAMSSARQFEEQGSSLDDYSARISETSVGLQNEDPVINKQAQKDAMSLLGESGTDWMDYAEDLDVRAQEPGEKPGDMTMGEKDEPMPNKKQAVLKAIANFLTVFTAQDSGKALMGLLQMRQSQMEAKSERQHDVDLQNLKHVQEQEAQYQQGEQSKEYLRTQQDLYARNQTAQAQQAAEYGITRDTIDNAFQVAMKNAGFNQEADMSKFKADLNGTLAQFNSDLIQGRGAAVNQERLNLTIGKLAMSGAPPQVLQAFGRLATGQGSAEDIKNANQWQSIMNNMSDKDLVRGMHQFYTGRYMDMAAARHDGSMSEQEYWYEMEGLNSSMRSLNLGIPGGGAHGMSDLGLDPNGQPKLDQFQQKVVGTGAKILARGNFEDFSEFIDSVTNSPDVDWAGMPDLKKQQVLKALERAHNAVRNQLDRMDAQIGQDQSGSRQDRSAQIIGGTPQGSFMP